MGKSVALPAILLIYGLCLPLAIFSGYLLSNPTALSTFSFLFLVLTVMTFPLFLKWHHSILIFAWNSYIIVFFFPGQLHLAIVAAVGSFFLAVVNRTLRKSSSYIAVPSVSRPLIFLLMVVMATMFLTGGFSVRALGSGQFGGKNYILVIGAIVGYFAFVAQPISPEKRESLASLFFLSGTTAAMSDLAYLLGPSFYFLFALFPSDLASMAALTQESLLRFSGFTFGALSFCFWILMKHGIAGLLRLDRLGSLSLFVFAVGISLLGGFRSIVIILALLLVVQFFYEGLFKTRYFPMAICLGVLVGLFAVAYIDKMPLSVQRSVSFLPIRVDRLAKQDAISTLDWRLEIWKTMVKEVPKYLIVGKGYIFNGTDFHLTQEAMKRGFYNSYEDVLITGSYHNGILTTLIPLGSFGFIAFLWFCWSGFRLLRNNYLHGEEEIRHINRFLLAYFVARLIFFFVFYGQFELDLPIFTGVVGLSISLNGGVCTPRTAPAEAWAIAGRELVPA